MFSQFLHFFSQISRPLKNIPFTKPRLYIVFSEPKGSNREHKNDSGKK